MRMSPRLLAASALTAVPLALAAPASAAINPVDTVVCVTDSVNEVAALADPANLTLPPEVAVPNCLAP